MIDNCLFIYKKKMMEIQKLIDEKAKKCLLIHGSHPLMESKQQIIRIFKKGYIILCTMLY